MKSVYIGFKMSFMAVAFMVVALGFYVLGDFVFSTGSLLYIFLYLFFALGVAFSSVLYWAEKSSD